jgi:hypothetical protein
MEYGRWSIEIFIPNDGEAKQHMLITKVQNKAQCGLQVGQSMPQSKSQIILKDKLFMLFALHWPTEWPGRT